MVDKMALWREREKGLGGKKRSTLLIRNRTGPLWGALLTSARARLGEGGGLQGKKSARLYSGPGRKGLKQSATRCTHRNTSRHDLPGAEMGGGGGCICGCGL